MEKLCSRELQLGLLQPIPVIVASHLWVHPHVGVEAMGGGQAVLQHAANVSNKTAACHSNV